MHLKQKEALPYEVSPSSVSFQRIKKPFDSLSRLPEFEDRGNHVHRCKVECLNDSPVQISVLNRSYFADSASSIAFAATLPAPMAEMTVAAPVTASPPA